MNELKLSIEKFFLNKEKNALSFRGCIFLVFISFALPFDIFIIFFRSVFHNER